MTKIQGSEAVPSEDFRRDGVPPLTTIRNLMSGSRTRHRLRVEADGSRPNLLYLAHRFPYPPDKGDRIRTYHLLRALSEWADIHLACFADEPFSQSELDELGRLCQRVEVIPLGGPSRKVRAFLSLATGRTATEGAFESSAMRALLGRWTGQIRFRSALASASSMAPYLRVGPLREIPSLVDLVDVDSQKWLDYASSSRGPMTWLYRIEGRRLSTLERAVSTWARALTLVSEAEAALFRRSVATGPVHAVTNGVDLESFHPSFPGDVVERTCIFVGALDYRPNVDAVTWFSREVWPKLLANRADSRFVLVGRKPSDPVQRLAGLPGVDLIGQVPDVRPHLSSASVALMPLRIARGVQNKVLEALAMGKAVVASPEALEGIQAEPGVHLLVASTPSEWVDAVTRLFDDGDLRHRLGIAGRAFVEESHDWGLCLSPFVDLLGLRSTDDSSTAPTALVEAGESSP